MVDDRLTALLLTKQAVDADTAFAEGGRGARRIVSITPPFEGKERIADEVIWSAAAGKLTPIVIADNWEVAIFNQAAKQDRHPHKFGTEIYVVRRGLMEIEVEGEVFILSAGDTIIVLPGSAHEVLRPEGCSFETQLVCTNCGGPADKFVIEG